MSASLLSSELSSLISESKRKNADLKNAAEKSLQELKALPATSEHQLAVACKTHVAKYAGSGVTCLQRLIISRGLPKGRLQEALEAFNACTDLGLEIQLKVLQALPSLLQNYADDLRGDLLSGALQVCSSLQSAKVPTVSGVAAATLQQLVTTVFEKVVTEDEHDDDIPATNEVPGDEGPIKLRPAAFDAYRVFRDLALVAEDRKTKFVPFTSLSPESSLELLWSSINANSQLFMSHPELGSIVRANVIPSACRAFSEKMSFATTLRSFRLLDIVLGRFLQQFPADCEVALGLATHTLDPDTAPLWKRALAMEMVRNFFASGSYVVDAYAVYDLAEGGKGIVQDLMSAFVRLSSEKPSLIGLGQQSTVPSGPPSKSSDLEQAALEAAGGVAGVITSALGVAEGGTAGISSQWSLPKTPCLEQLDKHDAPPVPETYIYTLVLDSLSSLADCLAKVILPLTVQHERLRSKTPDGSNDSPANGRLSSRNVRSHSFRTQTVPLNPLEVDGQSVSGRVKAVASLVESCWPAVLATSSTFLNASLDEQYYRNLIKAYQRFAQVAGLLRLTTARDALMTTLGKVAVPPHVLNAATSESIRSATGESPRVLSNPKSLLSVDNIISPVDRERRSSVEPSKPMLTTRNLLCLRALLNLAIALGPTLGRAFEVVIDTLRQADLVLSSTTPQQMLRQGHSAAQKGAEAPNGVQAFSSEVSAVEAAASRLLESTADYPDDAFLDILSTFCRLLRSKLRIPPQSPLTEQVSPPPTPSMKSRSFSGLAGLSTAAETQKQDCKFAIPKLGNLAELNISRFVFGNPVETGWVMLVDEMIGLASSGATPKEARRAATHVLCNLAARIIAEVMDEEADIRIPLQRRTLAVLLRLIDGIYADGGDLTGTDIEIQSLVVEALRAILERCGESLIAGWNRTIRIITSVFERSGNPSESHDDEETNIDWSHVAEDLVSTDLGKAGFAATQLICSDFLSALPTAAMPSLIELLYRFACQREDLNISLTSITLVWNVSDFLLGNMSTDDLNDTTRTLKEADDVEEEIENHIRQSLAAQWMLLLLRLKGIIDKGDKEVRKAAFQTSCSIFKNHGEQLPPATWDLALRSIVFKVAFNDAALYYATPETVPNSGHQVPKDEAISTAIVDGASSVVAQHIRVIEQVAQLPSLWEAFLSRLEAYLDLERLSLTTAVFAALSRVVARVDPRAKIWTGAMYRTLALWLKRRPTKVEEGDKQSNQDALLAYVQTGAELYRLTKQSMSMSQTRTLVENLYLAIKSADGPKYGGDISVLSPLQTNALSLLKSVDTSAPSILVVVAANLVALNHEVSGGATSRNQPTFLALSIETISWLQSLIVAHAADIELWESGALVNALESLRQYTEDKYNLTLEAKGPPIWRKATSTALVLSQTVATLQHGSTQDIGMNTEVWMEFVRIASGIVKAAGIEHVQDQRKIKEDQLADIESFRALREVLVPRLADPALPDALRLAYTQALFDASIVHPTEPGELPGIRNSPLEGLGQIRRGRVKRVPFSQREQMCYVCFSELVTLSTKSDNSPTSTMLAQAAMPLLILRLAIPVRAYIADQPLRGKRPQPLSEMEELFFCFDTIKKLQSEHHAIPVDRGSSNSLPNNAHVRLLYPLLAKAIGTAGDRWSGSDRILKPLQEVLQTFAPLA